jgi:hypothetical protein
MDYCLHPSMPYLVARKKAEPKEKTLSKRERKAHKILSQVPGETIIGFAIRNTLSGGGPADFRKLVQELKEQMQDAPQSMLEVIGVEGMEALEAL